jgi:hypothetical protein
VHACDACEAARATGIPVAGRGTRIISGVPAIAALFGMFLHFVGFWRVSFLNLMLAAMTMAVVVYDLWIIGGAASKINRLTDEFKAER